MSEKSAIANLITEDDTPVYLASGKEQRLLVSSIYSSPPDFCRSSKCRYISYSIPTGDRANCISAL
ncbi:MAG: hypothetical protein GDA43_06200 [Hormoscilla sp. SP5CHS1]|nr:hypothetical protein [Hormoscilla sp. SP5CHS1]